MDPLDVQLQTYYEAEAARRVRPVHGERRLAICEAFAKAVAAQDRHTVLDVGSGPASDHGPFRAHGIGYVGVDLAVGNGLIAAESGQIVVPASLFDLPFPTASFASGWSMSTFQHIPDDRIDDALAEFSRVLEPGAPVTIGVWGGRDEVIDSESSTTGIALPRRFVMRSHERIRAIHVRHFDVVSDDTFAAGSSDWEYHVATLRTPR